jgi:hypothetical protein
MSNGGTQAKRPLLWALITCLIAAVCALIAFSIGSSTGGGETGAAEKPASTSAPAFLPIGGIYASGRADGYRAAADQAYRRGRREGFMEGRRAGRRATERSYRRGYRSGLTGLGDPGGFYVVGLGSGPSLRSTSRLEPGKSYELCHDATAVCESRPPSRR